MLCFDCLKNSHLFPESLQEPVGRFGGNFSCGIIMEVLFDEPICKVVSELFRSIEPVEEGISN